MSNPTRGMVAGQPIQSQAQTREFDEGYERTFGGGTKERGRFVVRDGVLVKVGEDWSDTERRAPAVTEEIVYGSLGNATDGAPLNSRKKHRDYMRQNGLTLTSDFSDSFRAKEKADAQRQDTRARREAVARALYTHPKHKP